MARWRLRPFGGQNASARGQKPDVRAYQDAFVAGRDINIFNGRFTRLQDERLDPRTVFEDVKVELFTGREWLLEPLDRFLADYDHGYVIVQADAGLGKSALAAQLAYTRHWPCHFTRSGIVTVAGALRNLAAQLIDRYQLELEFAPQGTLPETAGEPQWFEKVLRAAAGVARDGGGNVVLVVDGLDEAEEVNGALPLGLPAVLPSGAFIVTTCRTGTRLPDLRRPFRELAIQARSPQNTSDLKRYLHTVLTTDEKLPGLLAAADVTADAIAGRLLERCGGVWIYLRYVLDELRDGQRTVGDIDALPSDLSAYYTKSLQVDQRDPEWGRVRLPLLTTLAAAAEPLPVPALSRLAGLPDGGVRDLCTSLLRPFLTEGRGAADGPLRYSIYHASLREFLTGEGSATIAAGGESQREEFAGAAVEAHARIADYYLTVFGGLRGGLPGIAADPSTAQLDDGYALRHLAEHLDRAGRADDLATLLACEHPSLVRGNVWYAAHERAGTIGDYRADIDRARRHAARKTDRDVALGREAPGLSEELRYLMIDSAIKTLTTNVPAELIGRLVQGGTWSSAQGFFYARQPGDLAERAAALAVLVRYLPEGDRPPVTQEAITAADQVPGAYARAWAFYVLLDTLPPDALPLPERKQLAVKAISAVTEITGDADRAEMLDVLSGHLPGSLLPEAAHLGAVISDEGNRARALSALIPKLPDTLLPEILAGVPAIADDYSRAQVVVALAAHATADMLAELTDLAKAFASRADRAWALQSVAVRRSGGQRDELLEEALSAARGIAGDADRVWALTRVAVSLPPASARSVLAEAMADALGCPSGPQQSECFKHLAPRLGKEQLVKVIPVVLAVQAESERAMLLEAYLPVLPSQFFEPVIRGAGGIADEFQRGRVVRALAPRLPEPLLEEALSVAGSISSADIRISVVAALADRIPARLLGQALNLVQSMTNESGSARFLRGIAVRMAEPLRAELLREALITTRSVTDGMSRAQVLGDIAVSLAGDEREHLLGQAVQAAMSQAEDRQYEFRSVYALDYLISLAAPAQREPILAHALATARVTSDPVYRAWWLSALARHLPRPDRAALLAESLEIIHAMPRGREQLQALGQVTLAFPGKERMGVFREILELSKSAAGGPTPAARIAQVGRAFPDWLILKVLEVIRQAIYEDTPLPIRPWLLRSIPSKSMRKVLNIVRNHPVGLHKAHALGTGALYVPAPFRPQTVQIALNAEQRIVARRAIMTQARWLWAGGITGAELEIFRQAIAGLELDEYLNVLDSGFNIITQVAGTQALADCLAAFRAVQRWWGLPDDLGLDRSRP